MIIATPHDQAFFRPACSTNSGTSYAFARYQQETITTSGETSEAKINGLVACYLGLAYCLYLLAHNVELQARLVDRLRDPGNFQGAYYELIVANILIRAGFNLTLEDEAVGDAKHCEFAAVSQRTGRKYWVEAKMRAVSGLLGRTDADGTKSEDPLSHLSHHLTAALKKPASDRRLIFVDVNAPFSVEEGNSPVWGERAARQLEKYEQRHKDAKAYVFVTNFPFHRMLSDAPGHAAFPFGLGIPDFNRPGLVRLTEAYKRKQEHIDAHNIGDAIAKLLNFPTTFDGSLPSEKFGAQSERIQIGQSYFFEDAGNGGFVGTVTTATVNDGERRVYLGVTNMEGKSVILTQPMSEAAFKDYKAHPEAYFGKIQPVARNISDPFELFEWFMESYGKTPRDIIWGWLSKVPGFNASAFEGLTDDELRARYCELLVDSVQNLPKTITAAEDKPNNNL